MHQPCAHVVGGGAAGLRAAEVLCTHGVQVDLFDRMPSCGRKLLVAGRGGLNLTHSRPSDEFPNVYDGGTHRDRWRMLLAAFPPEDLRAWAHGIGIDTFVGSSGRVFPVGNQSAALLRRWISRLRSAGVRFHMRATWTGFGDRPTELIFSTPEGAMLRNADVVVFALGGGSWSSTGSDGMWTSAFDEAGIAVRPLVASNCGWEVAWRPEFLDAVEGMPLKNIVASADDYIARGECMITRYGIEGGAVYALGHALRSMEHPRLTLDLKPSRSVDQLLQTAPRSAPMPAGHDGRARWVAAVIRAWRLSPAALALLTWHSSAATSLQLAEAVKRFPLDLVRPRPIDEAISSAGGVSWDELDGQLMIVRRPGVFLAGEMLDWDAPTGGYLLQGCMATGTAAALGAVACLQGHGTLAGST